MARKTGEYLDAPRQKIIASLATRLNDDEISLETFNNAEEASKKGDEAWQDFIKNLPERPPIKKSWKRERTPHSPG